MKNGQNPIPLLNDPVCPLISVIVLTYTEQSALYSTLDSIFMQDYPKIELIVSDDASGEQNRRQIIEYIEEHRAVRVLDYRVLCNERNMGTVAHANKAAALCLGEYIKFLPCGDGFLSSTSLSRLYHFADNFDVPAVTSAANVCSSDFSKVFYQFPSKRRVRILQNAKPEVLFSKLIFSNIICAVGALFRRSFFESGGFDESYRLLEDWPLWLKLSRNNIPIPCLGCPTVYYTVGGVSSQNGTAFESEILRSDLLLCYEKEILPFAKMASGPSLNYARYQYETMKYWKIFSPAQKAGFIIKHLPFATYRFLKARLKSVIIKTKGAKH